MIQCKECLKWFHPLGFPRHRAMHRDNRNILEHQGEARSVSSHKDEEEIIKCPECMEPCSQDELDTFGGICEECSGAFDN